MTMTQAEMQDRIVAKAGEDGEFRARLLAEPRAAIHDLTGAALPDGINVHVHEESATSFHLILPPGSQLTEEEMAQVFAGDWEENFYDSWEALGNI